MRWYCEQKFGKFYSLRDSQNEFKMLRSYDITALEHTILSNYGEYKLRKIYGKAIKDG